MSAFSAKSENHLTLRRLARLRLVSLLAIEQMLFLPVLSYDLRAQPITANQIVTDGHTATSVQTSGNVTSVTTSTVSGANAFNSFSQFGVGQGNTVNLYTPNGAQNLINIVRDAPAYVNGTLNSYANGKIGGNVYFADPYGFVVGKSGTVNVGSLNVSTPSKGFTDSIIGPNGAINGGAVSNLMSGSFPISPDGNIRILGRINAEDGVRLTGQNVVIGGAGMNWSERVNADHAVKFAASVNSNGLRSASGISVRNGSIHIGAANNATISGRLSARSRTTTPSTISVVAGKDIVVGKNAKLSVASKNADAGDIRFKAGGNLTVEAGASLDASSKTGNAGLVEMSANGVFDVATGIKIDLGAPNGKAGTLLVDPDYIVIGDPSQGDSGVTFSNATIAGFIAALGNTGLWQLTAPNYITLDAHAVIDLRRLDAATGTHSTANAYNVELIAPTITLMQGSQILAKAINTGGSTWTDGNVSLTAYSGQTLFVGAASATTGITVDGTITGRNITIEAKSEATSNFNSSTAGTMALIAETLAASLLGLNGGYVAASSTATVSIGTHANLNASGDISIRAIGKQDAEDPVVSASVLALGGFGSPVSAGVVVGQLSANVSTNVVSGAVVHALGAIEIKAVNDATADISAVGVSSTAQFAANVAYLLADVHTSTNVASGAGLSSGAAGITVAATNTNSFAASATSVSLAGAGGGIGAAIAISMIHTTADATFDANLGTSTTSRMAGGLQVAATSVTSRNVTSSSTSLGRNLIVNSLMPGPGAAGNFMTTFMASKLGSQFPLTVTGALSLTESNQSANASIGKAAAPRIYVTGDVAAVSHLVDDSIRTNSSASATSKDSVNPAFAISAAVAYGTYTHNSTATIGQGVIVNAAHIGVAATTELPNTNTWLVGDSIGTVFSHLNTNLGIVNDILTSYASASADSGSSTDSLAVAGAVSYFAVNTATTAWVSSGASLTATASDAMVTTAPPAVSGHTLPSQAWTGALNIVASSYVSSIDIGGNAGAAGILNGTGGSGSSVGGALSYVGITGKTIAGIGDAASVSSAGALKVAATSSNFLFEVAPTSGASAGSLTLNGITSIGFIDDTTHAAVSDTAILSAPTITISAAETISQFSTSGAIAIGGGSGIGLAVSYLNANTDTNAYIGDISNDRLAGDAVNTGSAGSVHADGLYVTATTTGRLTAASVAAVESDSRTASGGFFSKLKAVVALAGEDPSSGIIKSVTDAVEKASKAPSPGFSIDIAGSSSIAIVSLDTNAHIFGTSIDRYTSTSTTAATVVQAINNTTNNVASGSAALNLSLQTSAGSSAVAGALSLLISGNATKAYIDHTTINNNKTVAVQAMSGGYETAVGIGLAVGLDSNAFALAGSAGVISDSATAYISNSTISGSSAPSARQIDVDAYQTTNIGIGGGSLYISGGNGGLGLSITYASIGDPTGHAAVDAHVYQTSISSFDTLNVVANDASRISSGAAAGGISAGDGLAGAIVINSVSPTVTAYIGGTVGGTSAVILVSGTVTVSADSVHNASYDDSIANVLLAANGGQAAANGSGGVDFTGAAVAGGNQNNGGAAIFAVAGAVQVGASNAGMSLVVNTIGTTHAVSIGDIDLTAGSVQLTANDNSSIFGVAVGFGLATGEFAGVASTTVSTIRNHISAQIGDISVGAVTRVAASTGSIAVLASDSSRINGSAAAGGVSPDGAAVGLSIVYASIGNSITATIVNTMMTAAGDVTEFAKSNSSILTTAFGLAFASQLGAAGSVAVNSVSTDVIASVVNSDIIAQNNVGIASLNTDGIVVVSGALGVTIGPGEAGIGLSIVVNTIGGNTQSLIGTGSKVDALALGAGTLTVDSGDLNTPLDPSAANGATVTTPNLSESTASVHGLAVVATARQAIVANAVTAGLGVDPLAVGFAVVPITNVMGGRTEASITGALIDTRGAGSGSQAIDVTASSHTYSANYIISLAAGGPYGGAGAISTNVLNRHTIASISDSTVGTGTKVGNVQVKSVSTQAAADVVIGVAVALGGSGAASGIVNRFNADTESFVVGGAFNAQQLNVTAASTNGFFAEAGTGAASGANALAGSFIVAVTSNTTYAYAGDSSGTKLTTLNLGDSLQVSADSENKFKSLAVGAAGAGGDGTAGMVNVIAVSNDTRAGLYYVNLTQPGTGSAGVTVNAVENITINATTGAGGFGLVGQGLGAGANVAVLGSSLTAEIVEGGANFIHSPGLVSVTATTTKSIDVETVTVGAGGSTGIGAAIGVILLGTSAPADAAGQLNANGSGTLSSADAMTAATTITLSSAGIVAYRAALGASGIGLSDAQIRAAAQTEFSSLTQNGNLGHNTFAFNASGLALFAPKALSVNDLASYNALLAGGTVTNGVLTLTAAGVAAYRTAHGLSSSLGNQQVQSLANADYQGLVNQIGAYGYARYQALGSDVITFKIDGPGINAYRAQAISGLGLTCTSGSQCITDAQISTYANDQFQKLTDPANGTLSNGVITLSTPTGPSDLTGLNAFRAAAQADANAKATALASASGDPAPNPPVTVTDAQVQAYANAQYQFLIGHQDNGTQPAPYSVSAGISKANDSVTASIAGGTVNAANVNVVARANISTKNYATGVGASTGAGVGAAIAYTRVDDTVTASVTQATVNAAGLNVRAVTADGSTPAAKVEAHAGAGGMGAALGAAVADAVVNNNVTAVLGGGFALTGAASVAADDASNVRADAFGATAAGGLAVGVSVAASSKTSNVNASTLASSSLGATGLTISASSEGSSYAGAVAGVGGLLVAGAGADAKATDTSAVSAHLGSGNTIAVGTGTINVSATDTPDVKALSLGVSVAGGLSVGTATATATASPTVLAQLDGSSSLTDTLSAGTLTVIAVSNIAGTPSGTIPTTASTPSSTSDFTAGGTNAAAWAVAGSGAVYYAGSGTNATANNNSNVTANVDNYVRLPVGNVSILAGNTTNQVAYSTGVTIAGDLAIGVVITNANANTTTTASLGSNVLMAGGGTKSLALSAIGNDTNVAHSVAGSGGFLAGSGAGANTLDNSTVAAGVGNGNILSVKSLAILATHTDNYTTVADTLQAAAAGASGAAATHTANSIVTAGIGTNNTIAVSGASPGHCDVADCASDLTITANNIFNEVGSGPSANAGAGGGINGVGATSDITLNGTATVNIGKNTYITAGNDTIVNPGNVTVLATTTITGTDRVTLVTGGGIEGAGVRSSLTANVDNDVNIGAASAYDSGMLASPSSAAADQVVITSFGNIGIGTYTRSTANTSAYANTYGVAFVAAAAFANTSVTTNQNIVVGASVLTAFDNIDVTAGQSPNGSHSTYMTGDASAISFTRGLIAIPDARGNSTLNNNTSVNIASGASLNSGQNIVAGGYAGTVTATATGSGHGYELGFIPASDGHSNQSNGAHAELTVNGTLTAGIYNSLLITISCSDNASCLSVAPGGAPFSFSYTNAFDGTTLINTYFDQEVRSTLTNGLSASGNAFSLGQLFASGGTVTLNADHITGSGTVTAKGSPTISVNNASDANLVLTGAYIGVAAAGDIFFTGSANSFASGTPHLHSNPNGIATIAINNSYNPATFDTSTNGPTLLILGDVTNVNGLVTINNSLGSYGLAANLTGQQVNITVPNGAVAVSANDPSGIYIAGGSPFSEWQNFMVWPGGNPTAGAPVGDIAAAYLANTMFPNSGNADALNRSLYGSVGDHPNNFSTVFFGNCSYAAAGTCIGFHDRYTSWTDLAVSNSRNYDFNVGNSTDAMQPYIQYYAPTKSTDSTLTVGQQYAQANLTGSRNSFQIYGSQVAIKAGIININGSITAGRQTNYNIYLDPTLSAPPVVTTTTQTVNNNNNFGCLIDPATCTQTITQTSVNGGTISIFQYNYQHDVLTDPTTNAILTLVSDQFGKPLATYSAITNQITVANINASSGGGSVLLDGKIISTNQLGNIHVNGGYGNVAINNQTGLDLVVNGVNTGNTLAAAALTSTVTIIDKNITSGNNTSTYVYSPKTDAINVFKTAHGTAPTGDCTSANNCTVVGGSNGSYDPVSGLRFQWVQQATISRADTEVGTHWTFSNANQPWSYVGANGPSSTPQGVVTTGNSTSMAVFQETITGNVVHYGQTIPAYHGCSSGSAGGSCNFGFYENNNGYGDWVYNFPTNGTLYLTSSVKADNPFGINFGGNASGTVNIASNGNVIFSGRIVNPNGALAVASSSQQQLFNTTTGGNISQTSTGSILTQSASFTASGAIGSLAAPIRATMANAGTAPGGLSAQAGVGGVYLNLASGATLGQVSSGNTSTGFGDVNVTASGDLVAGANAQVTGRNITLISTLGGIGSIANPLPISANASLQTDGSYSGGIVNVVAHGDIGLTQTPASSAYSGDLRVGLIASASGDVLLNVPFGTILDASGQTASQTLTSAQVAAVSSALHLTALDGANDTALASVIAFSNTVNRDLGLYANLLQHGTVQTGSAPLTTSGLANFAIGALSSTDYTVFQSLTATTNSAISGGVLTLTANGITQFKAAAATALNIANPTSSQVQAYANSQYQAYALAIQNYANAQGTFVLGGDANSIAVYASRALTSADYTTFQNLTVTYGAVTSGQVTLTTAGLAQFRAGATAQLNNGSTATDAQVQAYANTLYQGFRTTVQAYAPTLYQSLATVFGQAYGSSWKTNSQVANFAANSAALLTLKTYGQLVNGVFTLSGGGIGDAAVANYAAAGLTSTQYGLFQTLTSTQYGSVSNGTLTLTAAGVANYASSVLGSGSANYTTFQTLTASGNSTVSAAGALTLTAAGVSANASAALGATYTAFQTLTSSGNATVSGSGLLLTATGIAAYASAALGAQSATFQNLTSGANGSLSNGVLTLTPAGVTFFTAAAAAAIGIATPSAAQVQGYANAQYQGYVQTIQSYANSQYQGYAQTIQAYASAKYQTYAQTIQGYANGQYQGYAQIIQTYAVGQYQPLQTATTFNATPAVAFSLLSASGSLQNGAFVLTNSGILSYAKSALSSANYGQFSSLLSNGTLSGGTFQLNGSGVSSLAQTALTQDYQNFEALYTNGSLVGNVWTLNAAGIAAFRKAASTAQNPNPTDAQVQAYANAQYQSYATNINGAANVQYQGYLSSISTAASTAYRNFAAEVLAIYNQNNNTPIAITALLGPNATFSPSDAQQFLLNYSWMMSAADRTAFLSLSNLGSIQNGTFVLNANNLATYAPTGLSTANFTAYSALLASGTLSGGVLTLTPAGLNNLAQIQLTPNYQSYINLTSSGALQNGNFVFSSAGVLSNAQAGVNAAYTSYQQLLANGTVTNGVFTLSSSGLTAYTAIAAAALGIASPTALQVQAYANQQYQNSLFVSANPAYQSYAQSISSGAQTQYTSLANQVFLYLQQRDQQSCPFGCPPRILAPGQTTVTDAQMAQYASQALSGSDLMAYQTFTNAANGAVSNGVLTLTSAGLAPASTLVLSTPLATAFNTLLGTGSVQGGQFVLNSATVLQNLQTLAANGSGASGVFQFNGAGILANASTALGTTGLQQLLASGTVQSATVNGVSTSSLVLNDPGVAYYASAALTAANYQTFQGLTASANGEVVNGVLTLSAAGIAQFSAATAAALHLGTASPTSAQVQAYANGQYQSFATTIKTYANSQFQGYGNSFQSYANNTFQPLQQQVLNYAINYLNVVIDPTGATYQNTNGSGGLGGSNCQGGCGVSIAITNAVLADWAHQASTDSRYNGPFGGGHFSSSDYASFTTLLGQGTVQTGTLTLSSTGLQSYYSSVASSSTVLNQSYQVFQSIVGAGNSTIQNGVLTLTSAGITNVRAAATTFLGNNPTDAQVQAFAAQTYVSDLTTIQGYAATQYQSYATSISSYGNTQYQSLVQTVQSYANSLYQADVATIQAYGNSQYQTLTANGTPQVSAGILSLVANSVYSSGQIVSTLSSAALLPSAGSVGTNAVASIVGRNVTLNAANSIGTTAPSVLIALTDLKNGTITSTQQAALSVATTPGSITFSATISAQALASLDVAHLGAGVTLNGNTLSGLTLANLPNGITVNDLTNVELAQTAPVYVNASGTFNATAGTTVYVQAAAATGQPVATLTVGQINAGGDVTLLAPQSIVAATNSAGAALFANQVVINPSNNAIGNLTLAATNAIGSAAAAFSYHINGKLISAQAGTDAYLTATGGDATFGKVFATNTISLTATNGNIVSYLAGVTMAANNIILNASGDVGTQNAPFTLQVGATGLLSGTIAGTAFIDSPTLATQNPVSLNVGNLTAVNGLTLISDAGITFGGAAGSSHGAVTVCSGPCLTGSTAVGGSITMAANASIQAAQLISLTAPGDIVLGQLTSTASPGSTVSVITVTSSGGAITANGDGHTNLTATAANAEVSLAANSVGTSTQRVSVNTPLLTATAGTGSIYLGSAADLRASQLSAIHGSVDIVSSGSLTLNSVLAGTATGASGTFNAKTLTANTGDLVIGAATSSGAMTVDSAGTLGFTQLTTTVGAIALTAAGDITGGALGAAAAFGVTSNTGSINLATANSGGSQTIQANQNVTFNALATTGVNGDIGNVTVNATNGFVLAQTVLVNGTATQGSVAANGSASLTAGTTNTGRVLTATTGSIIGGGLVDWTSLTTAAALGVTSTGGSINLATANSGGSQTIQANQNVTFNALATTGVNGDIGNVTVNATNGFVLAQTVLVNGTATQGSVAANGSASLTAGTTNTGRVLTATTGSIIGGGLVDWTSLTTAAALGVTSTGGSINLATANSGGSQTIQANQNVTFNALATTGVNGDVGDVAVNATNGFVLAQTVLVNGTATQGSVAANGSASLTAGTTNTGRVLTATTGSIIGGGLVDWTSLTTAAALGVTSTGGSINLATANSGGSQTIQANQNVTFNALATTGVNGDIGNVTVNATNGFVLAQTVLVNGTATQGSVAANGAASLTAATTNTGRVLTATTGSIIGGGLVDWTSLTTAKALGVTSNTGSVNLATANSGGSQTIQANQNVTFNALATTGVNGDIGNVTVNATNGFVLAQTVLVNGTATQGSVAANGAASLTAGTTITGNTLATTTGAGSLFAGGAVNWNTLNVAAALGVTSTGSSITLASAHSGGSQTLQARQNVVFNQLTTDGTATDAGDVGINAATGALAGGSINAHGSASLIAATSNTGHNLTTVTGAASLQGQVIKWDNLNVAGSLGITATTGGITLGTAISGGTQNLHAVDDIVFSQLTTNGIAGDAGDVNLRSDNGSILGGSVFANGNVALNTGKSLALDGLRGNSISLSAPGDITIKSVSVVRELDLAANTINVTGRQIRSNPSIPLVMNVTGYNGGIATSANITIDPDAIIINQFRVVDANFVTDAPQVTIVNGLVPGQLMLTTGTERILLDNRSPAPSNWATLQLYQPGGAFTLIQSFNANFTDSYVVQFTGDISSTVSTYSASHACCSIFSGTMAIRDIANDAEGTETITSWWAQKTGAETFYRLGIAGDARLQALQSPKPVEVIGDGPAVNIEGLTEARKLRQLQREGHKAGKPGWRSTGLGDNASRNVERFAAAQ